MISTRPFGRTRTEIGPTNSNGIADRNFEVACAIFCWGFVLKGPLIMGLLIDPLWIQAYLMGAFVVLLNSVRTLGAHRWTSEGEELSFEDEPLSTKSPPLKNQTAKTPSSNAK
jgi:hypothetical protein